MKYALLILTLMASNAYACQFTTDCDIGSQCLKPMGSMYGVCTGGMNPGNKHDNAPVYAPMDLNHTYGNTCSFDTDCGVGGHCAKSDGNLYGACL